MKIVLVSLCFRHLKTYIKCRNVQVFSKTKGLHFRNKTDGETKWNWYGGACRSFCLFILFYKQIVSSLWTESSNQPQSNPTVGLKNWSFSSFFSFPFQQSLPCAITCLPCTMRQLACGTPPTMSSRSQKKPVSSCTIAWGKKCVTAVTTLEFNIIMF